MYKVGDRVRVRSFEELKPTEVYGCSEKHIQEGTYLGLSKNVINDFARGGISKVIMARNNGKYCLYTLDTNGWTWTENMLKPAKINAR